MRLPRFVWLCSLSFPVLAGAAPLQPWQRVDDPAVAEVASHFDRPSPEYSAQFTWGWRGKVTPETIETDLDGMQALGVQAAIIDIGSRLEPRYLSPGYFDLIKVAVSEAKKRNMRLWIMDDGDYPSGMAGGKISVDRPDLRMRGIEGFRTSPTRATYNPSGAKDTKYSLIDYLNPEAARVFIDWTFGGYERAIGPDLGTTVLGFRGDEPAYSFNPWTPRLPEEFRRRKGYDIRPYVSAFSGPHGQKSEAMTPEQRRVYADYCDVWSDLFRDSYFSAEGAWCAAHGVEMQLHIEHEDMLPQLATADGDYFKAFQDIQVPGIDIIWHQLWMDNPADFPKLASSAAHLFGRPRAMCEAFAAYRPPPNLAQAHWLLNDLLAHGVNRIEYMFYPSVAGRGLPRPPPVAAPAGPPAEAARPRAQYYRDPGFPAVAASIHRLSYVLGEGRPAADILLYLPSSSFWLGTREENARVNGDLLRIAHALVTAQRDFDFADDAAFAAALRVDGSTLVNRSGQAYHAVIVPPALCLSGATWDKLQAFAAGGGKIHFLGAPPRLLVGKTFRDAAPFPALPASMPQAAPAEITAAVLSALPAPDLTLNAPAPGLMYLHRHLRDGELYFLFNSADAPLAATATLAGSGTTELWDAATGKIQQPGAQPSAAADDAHVSVQLRIPAWTAELVVVRAANAAPELTSITSFGAVPDGRTVNTAAIQRAIDRTAAAGGGTVLIPTGTFLSGSLFLKPGVALHLARGAILKGTTNLADYPVGPTRWEGRTRPWVSALINADSLSSVRIDGEDDSLIDGSGAAWPLRRRGAKGITPPAAPGLGGARPRLFAILNCRDVSVSHLRLKDQASWCVFLGLCQQATLDHLTIRAEHTIPSSDGMDFDSCDGVHVTQCDIDVNDDCISIKSGKDEEGRRLNRPSENILIERCRFGYGHGGVALGSEVSGGIRHVEIRDCVAEADNWAPVRIKSQPSRGGVIDDIVYRNLTLNQVRQAFEVTMEWRMVPPLAPAFSPPTRLENVRFIHVHGTARSMGVLHGFPNAPLTGVSFEDCHVQAPIPLKLEHVAEAIPAGAGGP